MDISNGESVGISLFVQGCHFHCKNCFNQSTWDFAGGKEWTKDIREEFLTLANKPQIKRVSILGGEPLAEENLVDVLDLVNEIKLSYPEKTIWLYSGYEFSKFFLLRDYEGVKIHPPHSRHQEIEEDKMRREIISKCNVMVDGRYIAELRDLSLRWRGSSNQNVINVQESIKQEKLILYCD